MKRIQRKAETTDQYIGLTGAEIFVKLMQEYQVKHIFGYPGGAILPVYDALFEVEDFEFILARHEQGAGHMAEGYARASEEGKPGVVLVTSGPGATNLVTPLQDALMDGCPVVAFTGQVATTAVGSDAFQEADVMGITRPCTKWNVQVRDVHDLARRVHEAFAVATHGRPGPVLVDLPKDVMAAVCREPVSTEVQIPGLRYATVNTPPVPMEALKQAADLINNAERPVIYSGQGVITAGSHETLRELAFAANVPVTTSLMGMGAFDERQDLSLHMLGMHGSAYANYAMQTADVIVCIGARFDDRVTGRLADFAPEAKRAAAEGRGGIIHFEIMEKQVGKIVGPQVTVVGDCGANMKALLPMLEHRERRPWLAQIADWKASFPFTYSHAPEGALMKPQSVIEELYQQTINRDDVVIATGVGQHQMWAAQFYRWRDPRSVITSGGLGTMGYGVPAAVGAKLAAPDKMVIDIDGDGSFSMTAMEMATAAEYNVGCKWLLLNNEYQGMVRQWQDLFYNERHMATKMTNPDFCKLAEAMHVSAFRCNSIDELPEVMAKFLECEGPVLGEFMVDKDEHVYPMVAAGKALDEMVFAPEVIQPSMDRRLASVEAP
jgi:acetolactate synthase-1/2/3 large subunit